VFSQIFHLAFLPVSSSRPISNYSKNYPLGCGQKDFRNDVLNDVTCPSVTLVTTMDANKVNE
jgi:hypothetical protein